MKHSKRMHGVTLVEILVTVVVISVGLLGVAALQTVSLRDNYSSLLRGQATALADDIIDRIRANRNHALSYNVAFTATPSGNARAIADVTEWRSQLQSLLPRTTNGTPADATGSITVNALATGRFAVSVTIQWGERGTTTPMQFVTRTEV